MRVVIMSLFLFNLLFALPDEFDRQKYNTGEKIFDAKCSKCHEKSIPIPLLMKNFIVEENQLLKLKAPTGNEISLRLKQQIGHRADIEFQLIETTDFVREYLYNPNRAKSICLEGVIRHFETMPSMKGKVTEEEIEDVTFFLYFLEGFNDVNEYYHNEEEF